MPYRLNIMQSGLGNQAARAVVQGGDQWLAHAPGYANQRTMDTSIVPPSGPSEQSIGSTGFTLIFNNGTYSRVLDGGHYAWQVLRAAGSHADGIGYGNVGCYLAAADRVYVCTEEKLSPNFGPSAFHPISDKGNRLENAGGNTLNQRKHDECYRRSSDEAIGQTYYELNLTPPPVDTKFVVEMCFIRGNPGRIWCRENGTLLYDVATNPLGTSGPWSGHSWDNFRGGGSGNVAEDIWVRMFRHHVQWE